MSILVELEDGVKCAFPVADARPRSSFYKLVGATSTHQFSNKDLTDPSNNLGVQAATPFTVSADSRFRGRYQTIQAAIDAAAAVANITSRKLVTVAPGNYNESIALAPYVDITGSGPATTVYGALSFASGVAVVSNLRILSPAAAFVHTSGALTFNKCTMLGTSTAIVGGAGATLNLTDSSLDCTTPDILTITTASSVTLDHSTIGAGFLGQRMLSNSGITTITHSNIRCQLYSSGGTCYAAHSRFVGSDDARVQLVGGTLDATNCSFESPVSVSPAVIGTGTFTSDFNMFKGRTTFDPTIVVRHNEEQSTSGVYTPAITGSHVASVASASGLYTRAGNIVTVTLAAVFTSTVGGSFSFDVSIPLGAANFAATSDAAGVISWDNGTIVAFSHVRAKVGTALITASSISTPNGVAATFSGTFTYMLR